jgi:hypothetical protein
VRDGGEALVLREDSWSSAGGDPGNLGLHIALHVPDRARPCTRIDRQEWRPAPEDTLVTCHGDDASGSDTRVRVHVSFA